MSLAKLFLVVGFLFCQVASADSSEIKKYATQLQEHFGKPLASLDAHFHVLFQNVPMAYQGRLKKQMETFMALGGPANALVLSPSYMVEEQIGPYAGRMHLREEFNQLTSELVDLYPDRLIGFCSAYHLWRDAAAVSEKCFRNANMKGLKLRVAGNRLVHRLAIPRVYKTVVGILEKNRNQIQSVLIHMPGDFPFSRANPTLSAEELDSDSSLHRDILDIEILVQIGKDFPEIEFVVAHSLNSHRLINVLKENIEKAGVTNFWIETSTSLNILLPDFFTNFAERTSMKDMSEAWRKFGIERVLFGSDEILGLEPGTPHSYGAGATFLEQYEYVRHNPFLTNDEKDQILFSNGSAYLETFD